MLEDMKPGDRVEVTMMGTVTAANAGLSYLYVTADGAERVNAFNLNAEGVKVRVLPRPLPTTPGSVVKHVTSGPLVLNDNGDWGNHDFAWYSDELAVEDWTLIYDAGAES